MASLTEISVLARRGIKWGALILVVVMLIPGALRLAKSIYLRLNPPPPPLPTVTYGKLPKLIFPTTGGEATPEFKLETIGGGLPGNLADQGKVYLVSVNKSRLFAEDRAREKAKRLGFTANFVRVDDQVYRFVHQTEPAEMVVNSISGGFSYRLDWTQDKGVYTNHTVPVGNEAVSEAKSWLNTLGLLPSELANGAGTFKYLVATGSAMVPTELFYEANFTRVDLYRGDKDELKVMTAGADTSPVSVIFSGLSGARRVVSANYQFSQTLDNTFATYPLKGIQQAWNELTAGKGYLAKRAGSNITVRKASLAYYEASDPQDFLQPVYVFEGDAGFVGYVQAVADEYVQ